MPQAAFNTRWIEGLKPNPHRQIEYFDSGTSNFGLRLSPQGTKAFFAWYRLNGRLRKVTLGKYDREHFGLAQARKELHKVLGRVAQHDDPGEQRATERKAETFGELAALYLEKHAKPKKKSWQEDERVLNKDVLPRWRHRKARDIKRKDVIALIDDVGARGPVIAANTLSLVRKVFNFAIGRDLIAANPCVQVKRPHKYVARERVLSDAELRAFLTKLPTTDMSAKTRLALEIQLRCALRPGEVAGARWDEFDGMWWTIPPTRSKNGLAHRVPITREVCQLLNDAFRLSGDGEFVFEVAKRFPKPRGPLHPEGMARAVQRSLEHFGIAAFHPHDLRRTAASHMTSMGVPRLVVSKILNHVEPGVTSIYDRHGYDREKREALASWQSKLDGLVTAKADEQN